VTCAGGPLLLCYDGSATARAAVEWAAAHAGPDAGVIVVAGAAAQLRKLGEDPGFVACAWRGEVCSGRSPADALLDVAHAHGASAIVIGSRHCGDTARRLICQSDVPVVVVPP
jgi:nucleotide-binding universal stress UspA family protein